MRGERAVRGEGLRITERHSLCSPVWPQGWLRCNLRWEVGACGALLVLSEAWQSSNLGVVIRLWLLREVKGHPSSQAGHKLLMSLQPRFGHLSHDVLKLLK